MAEKTKKCPHGCVGDPEPLRFTYADSPRYRVVVTCSACGAAGGPVTGNDEDDCIAAAVELWNRRAPAIEKAREALTNPPIPEDECATAVALRLNMMRLKALAALEVE